jgi:hypothetical protein
MTSTNSAALCVVFPFFSGLSGSGYRSQPVVYRPSSVPWDELLKNERSLKNSGKRCSPEQDQCSSAEPRHAHNCLEYEFCQLRLYGVLRVRRLGVLGSWYP